MNRHQKKVLSLAAAIANLSLSCAVAGVATYAWFTTVENATATDISISTATKHIKLDYVILKYDDDLKQGIQAGLNDPTEFVLPEYDQYIKERNKYCNIIVRANLVFAEPIDTSKTEIKIDITKVESSVLKAIDPADSKLKIQELTSNVTQFKSIVTSYTLEGSETVVPIDVGIQESMGSYATTADAMYKTAIEYFATRNTPTTFISLMNGQPVDPLNGNMITLVPELYNVGVVKGAVVYLECSYNEQLVDGFVQDHPEGGLSNLAGDIERIDFGVHDFINSSYGEIATGKYLRMNNAGTSYDGQYLDSYISSSSQQILDGTKTTGLEDLETSSGINTNANQKNISNYITSSKGSVYASDSIDKSSFTYNKSLGTYKSKNGHYVGNDSPTDGIVSKTDDSEMRNTLSYTGTDNYDAVIKPVMQSSMQLQYDTEDSKFAYYSATKNSISLYRYHENDPINATLTGITLTTSDNDSDFSYSLGEYFGLKGVNVIASYDRADDGGSFTINVTNICSYIMEDDIELIPEKTSFTDAGTKTITVSYSDGGLTFSDTYEITIIADIIDEMTISHAPTKLLYRVGESLDVSDLAVTGEFAIAGTVGILPTEYQLRLGESGTVIANGTTLSAAMAGDNLRVTVYYTGGAARAVGYTDPYFTITIKDYVVSFDVHPEEMDVNESITITVTFNAPLTWNITGTEGALSFDQYDSVTTGTTPYSGSGYNTTTTTVTIYGLDDGYATVTAAVTGHTSYQDSFEITVGDPPLEITFIAGIDKSDTTTLTKNGFSLSFPSGTFSRDDNYRCYAGNNMTISAPAGKQMVSIVFEGPSGTNSPSNFQIVSGGGTYTGTTWTGNSSSVVFGGYAKQVQITKITITYIEIQMCSVTISPGVGTGTPVVVEVAQGGTYTLQTYIYYNFTPPADRAFKRWEFNGNQYDPGDEITITQDATVTAIWSDIYEVSFDANDGTGIMNPVNVGEGSTYELPECGFTAPSGKTFSHWTVGGQTKNPGDEITITGDTIVTAIWKNLYTITYSSGDGTGDDITVNVAEGDSFTLKTILETGFTAPTGMAFAKWRIGNTDYDPGDTITNVTSNMTVTAIWATLYYVSFSAGLHGSGSMDSMSGLPGSTITLPSCAFEPASGYTFDYWQIGEDEYDAGDNYIITSANVTAVAIWKESTTPSTITDILNNANTYNGSTNSYKSWTASLSSGTVYSGQSGGQYSSIQLRSNNNNSGVVVTTSIGRVTKIIIEWDSNTVNGRTLDIYGKSTAYSAPTDLYDANYQGTLLGSIVKGTSTELTIEGNYQYIGLRSNSGAMYITSITIIWEPST